MDRKKLLTYVAVYAAGVGFVNLVDGPWRHWSIKDDRVIDWWTAVHAGFGAFAQVMGVSQGQLFVMGSANELGERILRERRPDLLWGTPESPANGVMDLVAAAAGWWVADAISRRA